MEIYVVDGTGQGPTTIAAFDAALFAAGIANYNLICLSSVVPSGARIVETGPIPRGRTGDRLYLVLSRHDEDRPGRDAWAGIAWAQCYPDGSGVFVEEHGSTRDEVEARLHASLGALMSHRGITGGYEVRCRIRGIACENEPVCALVAAMFKFEGW